METVAVVQQPVEDGGGEDVVAEDRGPTRRRRCFEVQTTLPRS